MSRSDEDLRRKEPTKKKRRVMVRKPKAGDIKAPNLKERSQIRVIQKAADRVDPGTRHATHFTKKALQGGLRRGDVDFGKDLNFKSMKPSQLGGTVLKKDYIDRRTTMTDRQGNTKPANIKYKAGQLHPWKPLDVQVASVIQSRSRETTRQKGKGPAQRSLSSSFSSVGRAVDKVKEDATVRSDDRKLSLSNFKTGTGKKPKDKRRRKIRVF
tara:strand:+ start:40169 stop:40804 length:636 start_codon:yes stop_codon:yes gene_type:complete